MYVLNRFDALILKMIFKKMKKHHFDAFRHEKHFEKQPQPHSQTGNNGQAHKVFFFLLENLLVTRKLFFYEVIFVSRS